MSLRRDDEVASRTLGKYLGKYPAVVVDNNDPQQQYRVKVRCEAIYASSDLDPVVTDWILPAQNPGMFFIPTRGDEVWIEFQHGHLDFPVYGWKMIDPDGGGNQLGVPTGFDQLSNQVASTDSDVSGDYPFVSVLQSPLGQHKLKFFDRSSNKKLALQSKSNSLWMDDNAENVWLGIGLATGGDIGVIFDALGSAILQSNGYHLKLDSTGQLVELTDGQSVMSFDPSGIAIASNADFSASDKLGAKVNLASGKAAIGNNDGELFDLVDQTLEKLITWANSVEATHVHPTAVGPSGPPTTSSSDIQLGTDLQVIKTTLDLVKGTL